jgi:hypothetical protein
MEAGDEADAIQKAQAILDNPELDLCEGFLAELNRYGAAKVADGPWIENNNSCKTANQRRKAHGVNTPWWSRAVLCFPYPMREQPFFQRPRPMAPAPSNLNRIEIAIHWREGAAETIKVWPLRLDFGARFWRFDLRPDGRDASVPHFALDEEAKSILAWRLGKQMS